MLEATRVSRKMERREVYVDYKHMEVAPYHKWHVEKSAIAGIYKVPL
jgi:hypothetical protein